MAITVNTSHLLLFSNTLPLLNSSFWELTYLLFKLHHPSQNHSHQLLGSSCYILTQIQSLTFTSQVIHPTHFCPFSLGDWILFLTMFHVHCFSHENRSPWLFCLLSFPYSADSVSQKPKKQIWQLTDASWQDKMDEATKIFNRPQKRKDREFSIYIPLPFFISEKAKMADDDPKWSLYILGIPPTVFFYF